MVEAAGNSGETTRGILTKLLRADCGAADSDPGRHFGGRREEGEGKQGFKFRKLAAAVAVTRQQAVAVL